MQKYRFLVKSRSKFTDLDVVETSHRCNFGAYFIIFADVETWYRPCGRRRAQPKTEGCRPELVPRSNFWRSFIAADIASTDCAFFSAACSSVYRSGGEGYCPDGCGLSRAGRVSGRWHRPAWVARGCRSTAVLNFLVPCLIFTIGKG